MPLLLGRHLATERKRFYWKVCKPEHPVRRLSFVTRVGQYAMRGIGPILYVLILGASPLPAQIADDVSMPVSVIANREEVLAANDAIDRERTPRHSEPCREQRSSESGDRQDGEQLKAASELPNSPSACVPLSGRQKLNLFFRSTYAPYTFYSAAFGATLAQAQGQWYGYGGGLPGWGKRFGASLADTESRRLIQGFVLSTVLHQDPRYFHSGKEKAIPRAWYAVTRVLVAKSDDGDNTFNSSEFLGALFTSSLQNAYYPDRDRGFENTMNRFLGALSSDASSNLLREFWPDIRKIFRKHAPKEIQKIERRIPRPPE